MTKIDKLLNPLGFERYRSIPGLPYWIHKEKKKMRIVARKNDSFNLTRLEPNSDLNIDGSIEDIIAHMKDNQLI